MMWWKMLLQKFFFWFYSNIFSLFFSHLLNKSQGFFFVSFGVISLDPSYLESCFGVCRWHLFCNLKASVLFFFFIPASLLILSSFIVSTQFVYFSSSYFVAESLHQHRFGPFFFLFFGTDFANIFVRPVLSLSVLKGSLWGGYIGRALSLIAFCTFDGLSPAVYLVPHGPIPIRPGW